MIIEKIIFLKSDTAVNGLVAEGLKILNPENYKKALFTTSPEEAITEVVYAKNPVLFVSGNWFEDIDWRLNRIASVVRVPHPKSIIVGYTQQWNEKEIPTLSGYVNPAILPWKNRYTTMARKLKKLGLYPEVYPILRILAYQYENLDQKDVKKFLHKRPNWREEIRHLSLP